MTEEEQRKLRTSVQELNNIFAVVITNLELLQMKKVPGIEHIVQRALEGALRGADTVEVLRILRKKAMSEPVT